MSKKKKEKKLHTVRKIILGIFLIMLSGILYIGARIFGLDAWHEFDPQKILGADESLIIYDSQSNELCTLYSSENRISVPLSDIPDIVQKAFISAEDARFYDHIGIDIIRIAGAAIHDIKSGSYEQGASTITQQLIKLSHLSTEKTMQRKAEEAVLAYLMEKEFEKDEILEMYLNYVYFGGGFYGIESAARGYFGISASELSAAQGAVLAGILKSPSNYAPHLNYEASMGRHEVVLGLMHEYGYLSDTEYRDALEEEIVLDMKDAGERTYYTDYAIAEACEILDITTEELFCGGYRIYTALDSDIQSTCDIIYANDDYFPNDEVQSAITVVDTENGFICAMIGGRGEYKAMSFNRAVEIRRQPGSSIKPIMVYAPAMEYYGYTAASIINDEPRAFGDYTPKNSGNKYYGNVTLRKALTSSLNIPAVTVLDDIGVENGKRFAEKVGIEFDTEDVSLALALGGFTYGVSPLQMAGAYASLYDGVYAAPSAVTTITDKTGEVIYTRNVKKERVLSEANAYILTSILCSVTNDGTGHRLSELGFDVASKTGTVSENDESNRDAWIAAYTKDYSVAVWIGYDSAKDGSLDGGVTGGSYPAVIARELFGSIYKNDKPKFEMPDGVTRLRLDRYSLENDSVAALATAMTPDTSAYYEYFAEGTEPELTSSYWSLPAPPNDFICTGCDNDRISFSFTIESANAVYRLCREAEDKSIVVVGEYYGDEGDVILCEDSYAPQGEVLQYYIKPIHKELEINGVKVEGPESQRIAIVTVKKEP